MNHAVQNVHRVAATRARTRVHVGDATTPPAHTHTWTNVESAVASAHGCRLELSHQQLRLQIVHTMLSTRSPPCV